MAGNITSVAGADLALKVDDSAVTAVTIKTSSGNVGIGETTPLSKLHVKTGESSGTVGADADELVLEGSGNSGMVILSGTTSSGRINFGDSGGEGQGVVLYNHSSNEMSLWTDAQRRITIDSSGKVGIGTASITSGYILETNGNILIKDNSSETTITNTSVSLGLWNTNTTNNTFTKIASSDGSGNETNAIAFINESDATNAGQMAFLTRTGSGILTERMRIDSSGNVGIGTSSPSTKLEIIDTNGAVTGTGNVRVLTSDSFALDKGGYFGLGGKYNTAGDYTTFGGIIGRKENATDGNYAGYLAFVASSHGTGGVERMRINSSGNVGIGTNSPQEELHVHAAATTSIKLTNDTSGQTGSDGFVIQSSGLDAYVFSYEAGSMFFGTSNLTRMTIDSSGNVGIGTSSPEGILELSKTGDTNLVIRGSTESVGVNTFIRFLTGTGSPANTNVVADIYSNISQANPSSLVGDIFFRVNTGDSLAIKAKIEGSTGDFYTNDGTVSSLSDKRTKKNISDLTDGIDAVLKLRPVTYSFNGRNELADDDKKIRYGFVADEVLEVLPQYVEINKGFIEDEEVPDLKSISMLRMFPMLVKAIQEQQTQIDALVARIEALEATP